MSTRQIRVLHIVPNMHAAGLETFIMNMYRYIDKKDVQFDFLTHYSGKYFYDDEIESLGGYIFRLTFREDMNLLKYVKDLEEFFKNNKYDIVHSHMSSTSIFTLYFAKKYNVPIRIVHSHNTSTDTSLKGRIKSILLKNSCTFANKYFACGKDAGDFLFGKKKFTIIHNAIDLSLFYNAEPLKNEVITSLNLKDKYVLGHVGRFTLQKNHTFLIDLIEKYKEIEPKVRLILVGEGELEQEIKEKVSNKKLEEYIVFLGVQKNMPALYKLFDVFLLPSLFEGMPVVGVECQAAGVETIFSDRITEEICITEYAHKASIDNGVNEWIKLLEGLKKKRTGINYECEVEKIRKAGFEVSQQAMELQSIYKELLYLQKDGK